VRFLKCTLLGLLIGASWAVPGKKSSGQWGVNIGQGDFNASLQKVLQTPKKRLDRWNEGLLLLAVKPQSWPSEFSPPIDAQRNRAWYPNVYRASVMLPGADRCYVVQEGYPTYECVAKFNHVGQAFAAADWLAKSIRTLGGVDAFRVHADPVWWLSDWPGPGSRLPAEGESSVNIQATHGSRWKQHLVRGSADLCESDEERRRPGSDCIQRYKELFVRVVAWEEWSGKGRVYLTVDPASATVSFQKPVLDDGRLQIGRAYTVFPSLSGLPRATQPPSQHGASSLPIEVRPAGTVGANPIVTIRNASAFAWQISFSGASSYNVSLSPNSSQTITLAPGAYSISGRADSTSVIPFPPASYTFPRDVIGTLSITAAQ
jgi:hypothetical protein